MTNRRASTPLVGVLAVVAAGFLWSCGGSHESLTAPVAVQSVQDMGEASGGVTSSGVRKITICHKGQTQKVGLLALFAHLRHHDRLGACAAAAACPCFDAAGLADMAAAGEPFTQSACSQTDPYSLTLVYDNGQSSTEAGTFEARVGSGQCSTTTWETGEPVVTVANVTSAQFKACKQAITGSSYYPAGCPR
jgi:hypothetical protein